MAHLAHNAMGMFFRNHTAFDGIWSYDLGKHTLTQDPNYTAPGAIQPASQSILESIPDLQRSGVEHIFHTYTELKIADEKSTTDKQTYLIYNGRTFKVVAIGDWSQQSFFRYGLKAVSSMDGR